MRLNVLIYSITWEIETLIGFCGTFYYSSNHYNQLEMHKPNYKMVAVSPKTHSDLVLLGRKCESFDEIISKLVAEHGGKN
jgi:hypothetical protein